MPSAQNEETPHGSGHRTISYDLIEKLEADVVVSAGFAATLALCLVMFAGLYSWSGNAPIFLSRGAGAPIQQTMPWIP